MREAGDLARATARGPFKRWTKGDDNSPVSEGDIAVNNLLRIRLGELAPGAGWLSEETEEPPDHGLPLTWVVDPIDGTRAYIAGLPEWVVSAALVENGRPIVACLFAPVSGEFFSAVAGGGATRNGAAIAVSPGEELGGARIAGPKNFLEKLPPFDPPATIVPRIPSLALRLARVAQGNIDATIAGGNSHDWDLAAADLLVHEAGGALTPFGGEPLTYNRPEPRHGMLVAAGRDRHAALLKLLRDLRLGSS
jgi:myo-inositol-1(or 4)-monophosphatase